MKPILIVLLGAGAIYALKQRNMAGQKQNAVLPQDQRGIATFNNRPTPQQPQQLYASWVTPPLASRDGGYVPAFGAYADMKPGVLSWNQA